MGSRQSLPAVWLITDERLAELPRRLRALPRGSGVIVRHHGLAPAERRRLLREVRRIAAVRDLTVVDEASGAVARVHGAGELRRALLRRTPLILLSPMHETRSHPGWEPMPRMRAAALNRLSSGRLLALGGMNGKRFTRLRLLGFAGWAGIDAFEKP